MATSNMATILSDRRKAAQAAQWAATPSVVPRANPATTNREVPPGVAPVRAFRPGVDTPGTFPIDAVSGRHLALDVATLA